jgi:hypothetical protein
MFTRWHMWGQGVDITLVENPALCAFLYQECQVLIKMAKLLEQSQPLSALQALSENLLSGIENSWNARSGTFEYWDRETHRTQRGENLGKRRGPGELFLDMVFDLPMRLMLRIETSGETTLGVRVFIHGVTHTGQHVVERIDRNQVQWFQGLGLATLDRLYSEVERIQVEGIGPDHEVGLHIVDHSMRDHSLLLPLWAKMLSKDHAVKLFNRTINKKTQYGRDYGIPACPKPPKEESAIVCRGVWLPWNALIGEGLVEYDMIDEAADLISALMQAIIRTLKRDSAFYKQYHADTGQRIGERSALHGLPPLGLFLKTLGVRLISPWRVALQGKNPFPWPVRLEHRGMIVERNLENTIITFPNGLSVTVSEVSPCIVVGRGN